MVKRVTRKWLSEDANPAMEHVYEHIGLHWPLGAREKIFKGVSRSIFPPNRRADEWQGYDRTHLTEENEFYYPITASLKASPDVWFKNLRLLQIRKVLRLITSLQVSMGPMPCLSGEIHAKMKALKKVVGKEMMAPASVPLMKATPAMSSSSNLRADSLRSAGLAARNARNP